MHKEDHIWLNWEDADCKTKQNTIITAIEKENEYCQLISETCLNTHLRTSKYGDLLRRLPSSSAVVAFKPPPTGFRVYTQPQSPIFFPECTYICKLSHTRVPSRNDVAICIFTNRVKNSKQNKSKAKHNKPKHLSACLCQYWLLSLYLCTFISVKG